MRTDVLKSPPADRSNDHYPSSRLPLQPNPLVKLPLGSVRVQGWLGHQIDLMSTGMHGRLEELSSFLSADNGWLGTDKEGWEVLPKTAWNYGLLVRDESPVFGAVETKTVAPPAVDRRIGAHRNKSRRKTYTGMEYRRRADRRRASAEPRSIG